MILMVIVVLSLTLVVCPPSEEEADDTTPYVCDYNGTDLGCPNETVCNDCINNYVCTDCELRIVPPCESCTTLSPGEDCYIQAFGKIITITSGNTANFNGITSGGNVSFDSGGKTFTATKSGTTWTLGGSALPACD